jgi:hypothetical protein
MRPNKATTSPRYPRQPGIGPRPAASTALGEHDAYAGRRAGAMGECACVNPTTSVVTTMTEGITIAASFRRIDHAKGSGHSDLRQCSWLILFPREMVRRRCLTAEDRQ